MTKQVPETDYCETDLDPAAFIRSCRVYFYAEQDLGDPSPEEFAEYEEQLGALLTLKQASALVNFEFDMDDCGEVQKLLLLAVHLQLLGLLLYKFKEQKLE
ncbi:hypothetical protein EJ02DRAFT_425914 [Clathrospora elynae]|uniref:Uncharacterized protein n=1 Tax=Clathrospora elynae TaxID=706981 RepID=A0A6A5SEE1_9PLEO|nr:hypothetical protein EJ02DRAFT_425914 [Clathrospora elynae]